MIIVLYIIFIFIGVLSLLNLNNKTVQNIWFVIIVIVLVLFAGTRSPYVDMDYGVYKFMWQVKSLDEQAEISFIFIKHMLKDVAKLKFPSLVFFYAILGVGVKMIGLKRLSPFLFSSIIIYFSHYFLLHEMTQIRAGVASGFILIALYYLIKKEYAYYYAFAICAVCFHFSASLCLLFPLLRNSKKSLVVYAFLIPIGYVLYFFSTYLDINIPIPFIGDKIKLYKEATESGFLEDSKINVFNVVFVLKVVIWYICYAFSSKISGYTCSVYLLLKIYALSLFSFLFLSNIPVFAFRVQELLGVVDIIIIPWVIYLFNERYKVIGEIVVVMIALVFLVLNIYLNELLIIEKL